MVMLCCLLIGTNARAVLFDHNAPDAPTPEPHSDVASFLRENGFEKYARSDILDVFEAELAIDRISDLRMLIKSRSHVSAGIPRGDAQMIADAARRYVMKTFLASMPIPRGSKPTVFTALLDQLFEEDFEDVEDLSDMEADDMQELGLNQVEADLLRARSTDFHAKQMITELLQTFQENGSFPFREEAVLMPLVSALVEAGVESLEDLEELELNDIAPEGILSAADLRRLKNDPRILRRTRKSEL